MNALIDAIHDGDAVAADRALSADPSLLDLLHEGMTPLLWAIQLGHEDIIEHLLGRGANPNVGDEDMETALHIAAYEGQLSIAKALLLHGAQSDVRTSEGKTPLMNAAQSGAPEVVRLLLASGANACAVDGVGRSALHWACLGDHDEPAVARLLLDHGADVAARNDNGDTAWTYAKAMNKKNIAVEMGH